MVDKRHGSASDAQSAVQAVQSFWADQLVNDEEVAGTDIGPSFFFNAPDLTDGSEQSFPAFIRAATGNSRLDEVEVISPFFADNPENKLHLQFRSEPMPSVALLLPRDHESKALCASEYHALIGEGADRKKHR